MKEISKSIQDIANEILKRECQKIDSICLKYLKNRGYRGSIIPKNILRFMKKERISIRIVNKKESVYKKTIEIINNGVLAHTEDIEIINSGF